MMRCRLARPFVVAHAHERTRTPRPVAAHLSGCLACQALEARTRRTARSLRDLREVPVAGESLGAWRVPVLGGPPLAPVRPASRWVVAGAGAAAALAAAAWLRRSVPAR